MKLVNNAPRYSHRKSIAVGILMHIPVRDYSFQGNCVKWRESPYHSDLEFSVAPFLSRGTSFEIALSSLKALDIIGNFSK